MADARRAIVFPLGHARDRRPSQLALAIGSIGVVYGDIGTSPLYAFRVAVTAAVGDGPITADAVLGVLSLIMWSRANTGTI